MTYPAAWHRRRYPQDVTYVLTHAHWPGGQEILAEPEATQVQFHAVRHDPAHLHHGRTHSTFTLLHRVTVRAQTTWPDAVTQIAASVPAAYRPLGIKVTLLGPKGERHHQVPAQTP